MAFNHSVLKAIMIRDKLWEKMEWHWKEEGSYSTQLKRTKAIIKIYLSTHKISTYRLPKQYNNKSH